MSLEKTWVCFGKTVDGSLYTKAATDSPLFFDSNMRDRFTPVIVELTVDPALDYCHAKFVKNKEFEEAFNKMEEDSGQL